MKILLINGSPKGKNSNSLKLAKSFIEGLREETDNSEEVSVEELQVASLNIGPCKGCFSCWKKTPGKCIIQDDMSMVIEKQLEANVIIWSFHKFGGDGALKNLLFVKTNYILTAAWGILYVLTAGWTWVLRAEGLGNYTAIFNYIILTLMGLFTKWFQKWYPAYVASGKGRKHG